jgi:hypothetical protein
MGPDHHRVFMKTPDLSVSNKKESRQRRPATLSEPTGFDHEKYINLSSSNIFLVKSVGLVSYIKKVN